MWRYRSFRTLTTIIAASALIQLAPGPFAGGGSVSAADIGYRGPSFSASGVSAPTGQKPQSKLWFQDGRWWAALFSRSLDSYSIWRLDGTTWTDSGVVVETRNTARLDVLWDGAKLYVLSAEVSPTAGTPTQVRRFTYNPASLSYTLDAGFPSTVVAGGTEAAVMDKDSIGTLWVTFVRQNAVFVVRTAGSDTAWGAPFVLPVAGATNLTAEDQSTIVAHGGKIGVMWSNQNDHAMYFADHVDGAPDGAWTSNPAVQQTEWADDHMNLKATADGRVFAATKTSLNSPGDPLILLSVLQLDGTWTHATFGTVADNHTRPIVVLDEEHQHVYMFASAPCCSGGAVYYKDAPMSQPVFPAGLGTPILASALDPTINNVTSTKQTVSSASGIVVLAGDDSSKMYLHNTIPLGADTQPPDTMLLSTPADPSGPDAARFEFSATEPGASFECQLDAAAWSPCSSPTTYTSLAIGQHGFAVRAIDPAGNADPTPATWVWTVSSVSSARLTAVADAYVVQTSAASNFGSLGVIDVDNNPGDARIGFVRFDLSAVTGTVTSATLRVSVSNGTTNGPDVFLTGSGWTETGVTWNNQPSAIGPPIVDLATVSTGVVAIDVTHAATPGGSFDLRFVPESSDGLVFSSREGVAPPVLDVVWESSGADLTPPQTTITAAPPPRVASPAATVEFTADEPSTFECQIDGQGYSACSSPLSISGLGEGQHQFDVRATDTAGNVDPSAASTTWTVDLTPPTVLATSPADGAIDVPAATAVQVTFSEPMNVSTVNTSTLRVLGPAGGPVAGSVTFQSPSNTATFTPVTPLQGATTYTIDIGGATDAAGNPVVPATTTFTTSTAPAVNTLTPTDDAHVMASRATRNFGSATSLTSDGGSQPINTYLRFDASQVTGTVQSAVLRLFVTNPSTNGPELALSATTWSEATVTWNTRPATVGGLIGNAGAVASGSYVEYDVTAVVTNPGVFSFVLSSVSTDATVFRSSEAGSTPPQLVLTTLSG